MTNREFVSVITNKIQAFGIDLWISPKFILKETQSIIANFLKKDNSSNRLVYKIVSGWTEIPNIPMMEVPVSECNLGVNVCQKLMRSKYQLPAIYESKFGAIIRQVTSLNFLQEYKNIFTPIQWVATTKREIQKERYYFFIDNYLYIPFKSGSEASPETIRIEAYFKDKFEVAQFVNKINESCADCESQVDKCKKLLDYELVIPSYLEDDVKDKLILTLAQTYLKITPDEYPNINDLTKVGQNQPK